MSCAYCRSRVAGMALREHVAVNACGRVPVGSCVPYDLTELRTVTEDDHRKLAERVARSLGWMVNHVERARAGKDGRWLTAASPGFPDSMFVHGAGTLLIVEMKGFKRGTKPELRAKQQEWLLAFASVPGVIVMRSTPDRWPDLQRVLTMHTSPNHDKI